MVMKTPSQLDLVFGALADATRRAILERLTSGEVSVATLTAGFDMSQPAISKHLRVLYEGGLVSRRREGTSILYAIGDPMVFKLCELVCRNAEERTRQELEEISASSSRRRR